MKLYKYTRLDQRLYENLANGTLWFSNARAFNDPYDCNSPVLYGATEEQIIRYYEALSQARRPQLLLHKTLDVLLREWRLDPSAIEHQLKSAIASEVDEMGLLCLSANDSSVPMWSHYADGHKGVLLEFDIDGDELFEGKEYWKVNYPPDDHYQKFFEEALDARTSILGLVLTKSSDWRTEQEYRIFQNSPGLYPFNRKSLTGVFFGYYALEGRKATVRRIIQSSDYPNVHIGHAKLHPETYAIQLECD